jgi:hypothetical protein
MDLNTIVFPLPGDDVLDAIERGLGISFSESCRHFIKEHNGAVPITNMFSMN